MMHEGILVDKSLVGNVWRYLSLFQGLGFIYAWEAYAI